MCEFNSLTLGMIREYSISSSSIKQSRKNIHSKHKQERRQGITLPYSSCPSKYPTRPPLREIKSLKDVIQPLIHPINCSENLSTESISKMNLQSNVSNAFYKSTLIAHLGERVLRAYPQTSSWANRTLEAHTCLVGTVLTLIWSHHQSIYLGMIGYPW